MEPGITQKEIERAVRWGYEHGEEGGKSPTNWGQGGQLSNMFPFHTVKTEENPDSEEIAENEKEEEEVIEEQCPQFADDIYEHLPEEIKKLLVVAKDNKERRTTRKETSSSWVYSPSRAHCFLPSEPSTATGNTLPTSTHL